MSDSSTRVLHDISAYAVLKIVGVLVACWLFFLVRDIFFIFFLAMILASLITPLADQLEERKIPRSLTVMFVYVVVSALLLAVISSLIPPLLDESRHALSNLTHLWQQMVGNSGALAEYTKQRGFDVQIRDSLDTVTASLPQFVLGAFTSITGAATGIVSLVVVFVLAFYLVVDTNALRMFIRTFVPEERHSAVILIIRRIEKKLGSWLRAQLILSFIIFLLTYIGLQIIGVPYALVLAVLAGLLEFIPYAGPVIAAVPSILIALSLSPLKALFVIFLSVLINQIEGHFLIPKINQKIIGINPVVSILALLLGARLAGVLGMLIAIPITATLTMFVEEYVHSHHTNQLS